MSEQDLRAALVRALEARDPGAAREALAGLAELGLNPRVVADDRLLDLTEETREWWMAEARAHRSVTAGSEAARSYRTSECW